MCFGCFLGNKYWFSTSLKNSLVVFRRFFLNMTSLLQDNNFLFSLRKCNPNVLNKWCVLLPFEEEILIFNWCLTQHLQAKKQRNSWWKALFNRKQWKCGQLNKLKSVPYYSLFFSSKRKTQQRNKSLWKRMLDPMSVFVISSFNQ